MNTFVILTGVSYATILARNPDEAEEIFDQISRGAKAQQILTLAAANRCCDVFGEFLGAYSRDNLRPKHQTLTHPEAS